MQDERSLEDQEALYRNWLKEHTDLPYDLTTLASQGSGECLDRKEYLEAIDLVESCQFDLVITEDLGRICRRVHAHIFCELCEDSETRIVALNDHVDTARPDWRLNSFFAVMRHETYNKDTGQRIRRTQRNRFMNGGQGRARISGLSSRTRTSGRFAGNRPRQLTSLERSPSSRQVGASATAAMP